MNEVWLKTLEQSKIRIAEKKHKRKYFALCVKVAIIMLCLHLVFPQYAKRLVYPYLFGKYTAENLQISRADLFEDITAETFIFKRKNISYTLQPRTKYAVTARVGTVEDYTTLTNLIFRGQFQGKYINLVPRDMVLVIGQMAEPSVFEKFEFVHEERAGGVRCKGVKYQTSFMPTFISAEKADENRKKYQQCHHYIKIEEYNNYHLIPANERINKALEMLLPNDIVHLEGILVDVPQMGLNTGTRKEQTHRNMRINGYAPGMCFILYTTKVILNNRMYK
ncbi:MAG: hypothetical protein IJ218_06335 [Alphaproteobacteria bacterium]|nr:hypothetical protein [Alphaproteobacteria bacterium]